MVIREPFQWLSDLQRLRMNMSRLESPGEWKFGGSVRRFSRVICFFIFADETCDLGGTAHLFFDKVAGLRVAKTGK